MKQDTLDSAARQDIVLLLRAVQAEMPRLAGWRHRIDELCDILSDPGGSPPRGPFNCEHCGGDLQCCEPGTFTCMSCLRTVPQAKRSTSTVEDYAKRGGPVPDEFRATVESLEMTPVLREFLEWFDSHFPAGGKALPGVTLWSIAEKARTALGCAVE